MAKINSFKKVNILILMLLIPVFVLYTYSYQENVGVLKDQIQSYRLSQLTFLDNQIGTNVEQLSTMSNVMIKDPSVKDLRDLDLYGDYINVLRLKQTISEKLNLQSVANTFSSSISVYANTVEQAVGQYSAIPYDKDELRRLAKPTWEFANNEFVKFTFDPIYAGDLFDKANLIIKVSFTPDNMIKMLNNFHANNRGETFFYKPGLPPFARIGSDAGQIAQILEMLSSDFTAAPGGRTIRMNGRSHLVTTIYDEKLDGYLIDTISLQEILSPIVQRRNFFYAFIGLLLLVSLLTSYVLYRNFQKPMRELIRGVQRLKKGDYSTRIKLKEGNEFRFLFIRFNEMAEEIENLIDKVFTEKLRLRDATLKQLQSQINPHFLYNCLAFIKSMAILNHTDAIVEMANNLGKYYRYTTRNENQLVTVAQEMDWVISYLNIQNLKMQRIRYEVDIPEEMNAIAIPRLLIQPIVENAIVHGLEPKLGEGVIRIVGECDDRENRIIVEDQGVGLSPEGLADLVGKLSQPLTEEIGCGLWNVHQRLLHHFGPTAGIQLAPSPQGGLKVTLRWQRERAAQATSP